MTQPLHTAVGVNGQLALLEGQVRISREGFLGQGPKGDKEISISSISSIQWRQAGALINGDIQFTFIGGVEAKGGIQATPLLAFQIEVGLIAIKERNK